MARARGRRSSTRTISRIWRKYTELCLPSRALRALPEDDWTGHLGFIHQVVLEKYLSQHENPKAVEYYLCGPPMMIKACTKMLADLGVPSSQIAYDEF